MRLYQNTMLLDPFIIFSLRGSSLRKRFFFQIYPFAILFPILQVFTEKIRHFSSPDLYRASKQTDYRFGQQHVTLYTCSSILALMPLEKDRFKVQCGFIANRSTASHGCNVDTKVFLCVLYAYIPSS
jgi:hypothetical protein